MTMPRRLVRYSAALLLLMYGFAKINGSQFTILDSELDKPMGHVSGFWLTWYYFGYSPFYGNFLGIVEIAGALLLTFRRTALLGACILAPVLGNIVLIDICYGVELGATITAALLLLAMLYLIAPHRKELMALFWPAPGAASKPAALAFSAWGVRAAMLALTFAFTYWTANFNNRAPTPIDGTWDVVGVEPATLTAQLPVALFFEYNRAHMAVFKTSGGNYQQRHFEVDRNNRRIGIWENWLTKGAQIFDGNYRLAGRDLSLSGTWQGADVVLQLHGRGVR